MQVLKTVRESYVIHMVSAVLRASLGLLLERGVLLAVARRVLYGPRSEREEESQLWLGTLC